MHPGFILTQKKKKKFTSSLVINIAEATKQQETQDMQRSLQK